MKTSILTFVFVALTTLVYSQFEKNSLKNVSTLNSEEVKCVIYPNKSNIVTLILEKEPGQLVKVQVKDENNKLVYQSRIKKENCTRIRYDLKELPSGEYKFELVKNKKVMYSASVNKSDNIIAVAE